MSITALANAIANNMSDEDIELAAVFFTQLGDSLATISVHRSVCSNKSNKNI